MSRRTLSALPVPFADEATDNTIPDDPSTVWCNPDASPPQMCIGSNIVPNVKCPASGKCPSLVPCDPDDTPPEKCPFSNIQCPASGKCPSVPPHGTVRRCELKSDAPKDSEDICESRHTRQTCIANEHCVWSDIASPLTPAPGDSGDKPSEKHVEFDTTTAVLLAFVVVGTFLVIAGAVWAMPSFRETQGNTPETYIQGPESFATRI